MKRTTTNEKQKYWFICYMQWWHKKENDRMPADTVIWDHPFIWLWGMNNYNRINNLGISTVLVNYKEITKEEYDMYIEARSKSEQSGQDEETHHND